MSHWVGVLFSPISYILSPLYRSRTPKVLTENLCSADELTKKIQGIIRSLQEQPNKTYNTTKSQTILFAAIRLLDSDYNIKKISPIIQQIESGIDKTQKIFNAKIFDEGILQLEKIEDELVKEAELLGSIIYLEMDNRENYTSRRCTFDYKKGELFLKPDRSTNNSIIALPDLTGYPALAQNSFDYLQIVTKQLPRIEQLDETYIRDLFQQPDLNVPSDIEVRVGEYSVLLREQAVLDLTRINSLYVNGVPLIDLSKNIDIQNRVDKKKCSSDIFLMLHKHLAGDNELTNNVTKLLTQASLARPFETVFFQYTNPDLGFFVQQDSYRANHIWIESERSKIHVQLEMLIQIIRISQKTGEKKVIRYGNISRCFTIPLQSLREGSIKGGGATDSYSQFYAEREEAIKASKHNLV